MQPINQFQGAPTSAMNFPMEAYMQAIGNASRAVLGGSQAMGEGISQGMKSVGQAYGDYKKMESEVKSGIAFAKDIVPTIQDESTRKSVLEAIDRLEKDPNLSLQQKHNQVMDWKNFVGGAISQQNKLEQIRAEGETKSALAVKQQKLKDEQEMLVGKSVLGSPEEMLKFANMYMGNINSANKSPQGNVIQNQNSAGNYQDTGYESKYINKLSPQWRNYLESRNEPTEKEKEDFSMNKIDSARLANLYKTPVRSPKALKVPLNPLNAFLGER